MTAQRLLRRGSVIAFDYFTTATAELIGRPWREWLRTYRHQGRGEHYLGNPGSQDITAQVCLDQLPLPRSSIAGRVPAADGGSTDLVDEGRRAWTAAAARPDVAALTMRSRTREAEALLDQRGLGAFRVVSWTIPDSFGVEHGA